VAKWKKSIAEEGSMSAIPHGGFVVTTDGEAIYHDTVKYGTIKKIIELLAIDEHSPKVGKLGAHDINSIYIWTPKPPPSEAPK
jgi:hypothetical protein